MVFQGESSNESLIETSEWSSLLSRSTLARSTTCLDHDVSSDPFFVCTAPMVTQTAEESVETMPPSTCENGQLSSSVGEFNDFSE